MWAVSDRFLFAIPRLHHNVTTVTVTPPGGGGATRLTLGSGTCTFDRTQRIRRTANLSIRGTAGIFALLSTPGARVAVDHGIRFGGVDQELVPMIRGELSSAALVLGDGMIQIAVADLWQGIAAADYLFPYTPAITAGRVATIIAAVQDVYPGITIRNTASDTGPVGTAQAWTSRADMINGLATDGGGEAFFAPDGAFVLRDQPKITDQPVWLIKTGPGGTLESLTRSRPLDRLYNTVVLLPATADKAQTWSQVVVQITDPANQRHPSKIGVRPYRYTAPSILTQADAVTVAQQILVRVQGSTETLSLGALTNPALEGGDIVRVLTPIAGGKSLVNHFLDSGQINFTTGSMTCATRASQELGT